MFRDSAAGMVLVGTDYRFLEVNDAFCRMLGYTQRDLLGKTFQDVTHPDDREVGAALTQQVLSGQRDTFQLEKRYVRRDGSLIWGLVSASLVKDTTGKPLYFITQIQDISQRKQFSRALAQSEERYRRLFQEMIDGCTLCRIILDDDGRPVDYVTLEVNKSFEHSLGVDRSLVVGKNASDILPPEELQQWLAVFAPIAVRGGAASYLQYSSLNDKYFEGQVFSYEKNIFVATFRDVTARRNAELEVNRHTRLNQLLLDGFPCVALLIRPSDRVIMASNRTALEAGAVPGTRCNESWFGKREPCPWCQLPEMLQQGEHRTLTVEALDRVWDAHWIPAGDDLCIHYAFDITEQVRAMKKLNELEERFRFVIEEVGIGLWDWDIENDHVYYSSTWYRILGEETPLPRRYETWEGRIHPDDRSEVLFTLQEHLEGRSGYWLQDHRLRTRDGGWLWVVGHGHVVSRDNEGKPLRMVGTIIDISQRKKAEEALRERERDLRQLSQRLIRVREDERNRIARNIHDDLGHAVMNIKMNLFQAELLLGTGQSPLRQFMKEMKDQVDDLLESIQRISMEIRPAVLYDLGLAEALRYHIRRFEEQTKIPCRVIALPDIPGLLEETGISVYRIIQEVFVNMFRHSGCTEITLELKVSGGQAELTVADNGKGIDPERIGSMDSLGIMGMKERALSLGGNLDIRGEEGRGTTVSLTFPLPGREPS